MFGVYAGYALVASRSVFAAVALHSMCNYLGFPHLKLLWTKSCSAADRTVLRAALGVGVALFFLSIGHIFDLIA